MKITLCGSIAFYKEMKGVRIILEKNHHEVKLPPREVRGQNGETISVQEYYKIRKSGDSHESWIWERKAEAIMEHFKKVEWAEAILVTNYDKNGVSGYVGGNTLMEMGVAFFLNKKIYLLNNFPELSYKEEILGMKPIVIDGNLELVSH